MRRENLFALRILTGIALGLLLAACSIMPPGPPDNQDSPPPVAMLPPPPSQPAPTTSSAMTENSMATQSDQSPSYPRYGNSDDFLCNNNPPGDPRGDQACIRLRGSAASRTGRPTSRYGGSDDFICNRGLPEDPRTVRACRRLRGTGP